MAKKIDIKEDTLKVIKRNRYARVQLDNIDETMERVDSGATPVDEYSI